MRKFLIENTKFEFLEFTYSKSKTLEFLVEQNPTTDIINLSFPKKYSSASEHLVCVAMSLKILENYDNHKQVTDIKTLMTCFNLLKYLRFKDIKRLYEDITDMVTKKIISEKYNNEFVILAI